MGNYTSLARLSFTPRPGSSAPGRGAPGHGYGCSVIGSGGAGGCSVQPEPVLEVRGILPRPDDLPCCVAALRGGFTVGETEGLAELVGGELGAPGRSSHLLTPRLGNRARVHRVETGVVDQPHDELLAFGRVSRHRQREPGRLTVRLPLVCKRVGKLRVPGPNHGPAPLLLQPGGLRLAGVDRFNRASAILFGLAGYREVTGYREVIRRVRNGDVARDFTD